MKAQTLEEILGNIRPLDETAMAAAEARQGMLVKPAGSLGRLESLSIQMAGITGQVKNHITKKIHFVLGADNGVYDEGVAAAPQSFTHLLMGLYARGDVGCGISVLCRRAGVDLRIVDMGVKGVLDHPDILSRKLMEGTGNIRRERAMSPDITRKAVDIGIALAADACANGYGIIGTGEVGMANTTTAAACIGAAMGMGADTARIVGRGAGLTDEAYARKQQVVVDALQLHQPPADDAIEILSTVGGLDIAGMVGLFLGAASYRIPVVIDGVISIAAALLACKLQPLAKAYMIPSHLSEEPAYVAAANALGLEPMLDLRMRLGEGTGCPIAMQVVEDALALMNDMSTFAETQLQTEYREGIQA